MSNIIYRYTKAITRRTFGRLLGKRTPRLDRLLGSPVPMVRFSHPVLRPGGRGDWDAKDVHSNSEFRDGKGKYWMYYNGGKGSGTNKGIGLAESEDGINFTKNPKNPLLTPTPRTWEGDFLWKCNVLKLGEKDFRMWYGGHCNSVGQVGYAASADGINWRKYEGNPVLTVGAGGEWDSENAETLQVVYEGSAGGFKGLYFGARKLGISAIGLATSPDGVHWTKYPDNPVLIPLPDTWEDRELGPMHLMKLGDIYVLFYEGRGKFNRWMNGIAYSRDLINWRRDLRNPFMGPGFPGDFDAEFVSDPSVVVDSDCLKIYYGCASGDGSRYVGLAYLPLNGEFSDYFRNKGTAWHDCRIDAGDTTDGVTCQAYDCEINFTSDADGTLTIDTRQSNGSWHTHDTVIVNAGKVSTYSLRYARAVRISFDQAATVTAGYNLRQLEWYEDIFASLRKEAHKD